MAYRSFTPLATRKNPSFTGLSLKLDGISDFISMQGAESGMFRHGLNSTRLTTSSVFAPQTWLFWVKFPQSTLTDVITHTAQYGADMKHFILKQTAAIQGHTTAGGDQEYWAGQFVGLVADGSGNVKVAAGWGRTGAKSTTNRLIRRATNTTISANQWYMITVVWNGKSQISHGKIYVNNVEQTLAAHYATGGATEMNVNTTNYARPFFYYILYAPSQGFGGQTFSQGQLDSYQQAAATFDCCLGRNQDDYLAMTIMDCAYWGRTALDADDVTGLYGSNNPSAIQYHVNGGSNINYDKGTDVHATVDIGQVSGYQNGQITLSSPSQTYVYYFAHNSSNVNEFGEFPYGLLTTGAHAGKIFVSDSAGNDPNTFDADACATNWKNAINALHTGLSATDHSSGFITITQGVGGTQGNLNISYQGIFANFFEDGSGGSAPTAFSGGIDRLHGVWKFRGPRIGSTLDNTLQGTDNRFSEYNEDIDQQQRSFVYEGVPSDTMLDLLPSNTSAAVNNGGTWVNDTAPATE